jgi:uncharacterized protein
MGLTKIYLDTCIAIYFVEKHPLFSSRIQILFESHDSLELCYSPLVQLECLVMPLRRKDTELRDLFLSFFSAQTLLEISSEIFETAAQMRADFPSLKTPDALHLATATHYECDGLWTNDNRLETAGSGFAKNVFAIMTERGKDPMPSNRDYTKYSFNNETYGKGRLVLAIVREFVSQNPEITFEELKARFPGNIQGSMGVVQLASAVLNDDKKRRRYFSKPREIIHLPAEGCDVVVCSQWGRNTYDFVQFVRNTIGFEITET